MAAVENTLSVLGTGVSITPENPLKTCNSGLAKPRHGYGFCDSRELNCCCSPTKSSMWKRARGRVGNASGGRNVWSRLTFQLTLTSNSLVTNRLGSSRCGPSRSLSSLWKRSSPEVDPTFRFSPFLSQMNALTVSGNYTKMSLVFKFDCGVAA